MTDTNDWAEELADTGIDTHDWDADQERFVETADKQTDDATMTDKQTPSVDSSTAETMTDDTDDTDVVEKQHSGASIEAKVKRGTGTRDQDTIKIKGKGKDAEEAIQNFDECLQAVWDGGWAYKLRGLQPFDEVEE